MIELSILTTKIPGFINQYQGVGDKGLLWELVKMEIRAYTINFSKQRAKQQKNVEAELVKKAQNLKRKLAKKETQELLAEHDKIIRELESISLQRTRGACLRWLKTVSSTFQDVDFYGPLLPLFIS